MTRVFLWITLAASIAAAGFAMVAFPGPGEHPAITLAGLLIMGSSVLVAAYGLDNNNRNEDQ